MTRDELDIDVEQSDPVGHYEKLTLQTLRRTSIPPEFTDHLDLSEGDDIFLLLKEESVEMFTDVSDLIDEKDKL